MTATAITETANVLGDALAPVFAEVADWRQRVEELFRSGAIEVGELDDAIKWLVMGALLGSGSVLGAGFVAAPDLLAEAPWHMAWWLSPANGAGLAGKPGTLRRLASVEDPRDDAFLDYTRLEWWRGTVGRCESYLTGPYLDYVCTDELTLTLTMPVELDGRTAGLVGADLSVADLENLTYGALARAGVPAVLGTSAGRIVAATTATVEPGMPASRFGPLSAWHPVPGCGGMLSVAHVA